MPKLSGSASVETAVDVVAGCGDVGSVFGEQEAGHGRCLIGGASTTKWHSADHIVVEGLADTLAAACAGLAALGQGMGTEFGTGGVVRQIMVEFDGGFLFLRGAGDGFRLAVVTEAVIDPALIAQQMQAQVGKIGERALSAPSRHGRP